MRTCPLCMTKVAAGRIAAYSNDLECPNCRARLDVAPGSRYLSILIGLAAAALVWHAPQAKESSLGWVLPLVYAFLTLSVVSPLVLMVLADLRVKLAETVPAAAEHAAGEAPQSAHH